MVIDNFSAFDFNWMVSDKAISFLRPAQSAPVAAANDNNNETNQTGQTTQAS